MWLDDLNKVIGDGQAKHIRHIRDVRLPKRSKPSSSSPCDAIKLFENYPELETCGILFGPFREDLVGYSAIFTWFGASDVKLADTSMPCAQLLDAPRTLRKFVPRFSACSSRDILRDEYGISEPCEVHIIQVCSMSCWCDDVHCRDGEFWDLNIGGEDDVLRAMYGVS